MQHGLEVPLYLHKDLLSGEIAIGTATSLLSREICATSAARNGDPEWCCRETSFPNSGTPLSSLHELLYQAGRENPRFLLLGSGIHVRAGEQFWNL